MNWIFSASIIASFFSGMVALFAPCCVSVLLPTYITAIFRQKGKVIKMTLVYFAGIATILIPIGLGAAFMAEFFRDFHIELYIVGGVMMVALGLMSFASKGMSVMMPKKLQPKVDSAGSMSAKAVFVLGVFSGAATSCCAPVLAGALTLAVLSGAFVKAIVVVFAYVLGMTFPLFILAFIWEKSGVQSSKLIVGKLLEFKIGKKKVYVHSTNLITGILFLSIGLMLIYLALSGNVFWAPEMQTAIGETLTNWSVGIVKLLQKIPDYLWGIIFLLFFGFFVKLAIKK